MMTSIDSGPPSDHEVQLDALRDIVARLKAMDKRLQNIEFGSYAALVVFAIWLFRSWH